MRTTFDKAEYNRKWREAHPEYHGKYRRTHRAERQAYNAQYQQEHREERATYKAAYDATHAEEKAEYTAEYQRVNREATNAKTARWRRNHPEAKRAAEHRRRVRKNAGAVEYFTDLEVFERDGWVCQLCGRKINRRRKYPDLLSPSLDHIIPISKDGHHTRANVQATHLRCNISKGNR